MPDRLPRDGSVTLLDTRTVEEFAHGHIDGFFNIPVDELRERLGELDKRKPVYVICQSGLRSYIACRILAGNGFDCYNFSGGFRFYDAVTNDRCLIESATGLRNGSSIKSGPLLATNSKQRSFLLNHFAIVPV